VAYCAHVRECTHEGKIAYK